MFAKAVKVVQSEWSAAPLSPVLADADLQDGDCRYCSDHTECTPPSRMHCTTDDPNKILLFLDYKSQNMVEMKLLKE